MTGWKEWYDQHGEDNQLESWDDVWQIVAQMSANEEEEESNGTTPTPILDPPKDDLPF